MPSHIPPKSKDEIKDDIMTGVCKVVESTGARCDLGKKPSELNWVMQFWLTCARNMCDDLGHKYPHLNATNDENREFHGKKLAEYCSFLEEKITAPGA
jgi:hypothetical protein